MREGGAGELGPRAAGAAGAAGLRGLGCGGSPPQPRRGGCAIKEKLRSILDQRRRGGVGKAIGFGSGTTPPRPLLSIDASRLFLEVASTPPQLRRGAPQLTPGTSS